LIPIFAENFAAPGVFWINAAAWQVEVKSVRTRTQKENVADNASAQAQDDAEGQVGEASGSNEI
jgi:hypothetical protein